MWVPGYIGPHALPPRIENRLLFWGWGVCFVSFLAGFWRFVLVLGVVVCVVLFGCVGWLSVVRVVLWVVLVFYCCCLLVAGLVGCLLLLCLLLLLVVSCRVVRFRAGCPVLGWSPPDFTRFKI